MYKNKKTSGFTLMELIIILAIVAILASMAAPSFSNIIQTNRMSTQYNELLGTLSLARSEAVKRGVSATVCKSDNGSSCGGSWHEGWLAFVDIDRDGVVDSGEEVVRIHSALSGGNTLVFARNRVTYDSDGLATGFTGTFTLCDSRGDTDSKGLVVSNTGRVRQAVDSDSLAGCP